MARTGVPRLPVRRSPVPPVRWLATTAARRFGGTTAAARRLGATTAARRFGGTTAIAVRRLVATAAAAVRTAG
jgi:hypothetical protein